MRRNKKGFSLIELLAVVIIMGVLLLVGVTAVSSYISESRKDGYLTNVGLYINATRTMYGGEKLSQTANEGEALLVPIEITDTDYQNKGFKSPYGDFLLERSYIIMVNNGSERKYYIVAVDEQGYGLKGILEDELKKDSIVANTKLDDYPKIEEIKDGTKTITIDGTEYKVSPRNDLSADTVLLITANQQPRLTVMKIDKDTGKEVAWTNGDWAWKLKLTLKSPINDGQLQKYQWYKNGVWEDFCSPGKKESCVKEITGNYDEEIKFRIVSLTGEVLSPESDLYQIRLDDTNPECTLGLDGTLGDDDWYTSDVVTVKFTDTTDTGSGVLQYGIGDFTTKTKDITGNYKTITVEGNVKDKAGNSNTCSITFKKNSNKLVLTLSPNGGSTTILQDNDTIAQNVKLTITGVWEEDLETAQYVISKDNVNEPTTGWTNFTNGQEVTVNLSGGDNYLWTKVINNAGTRADQKVSNDYIARYTIAYDANSGTGAPSSQVKSHNESITLSSSVPTRSGWVFQGWSKTKNSKTVDYAAGATYTENQARTLYAVWKRVVTVTFMPNGSSTTQSTQTCEVWNNESGCSVTSPSITAATNFTALGWNTSATATSSAWSVNSTKTVSANTTYYAITRSTDKITVTFNVNGASSIGSTSQECYKYNGGTSCNITSPVINAKTGYSAVGWNTSATATSSAWNTSTAKSFSANATYYAITKRTLTATFNKNNASSIGSTSQSCTIYNSETTCTVTSPTIVAPTGYKVVGWNTSSTATTSQVATSTTITLSSDVTYYAIIAVSSYQITFNGNGSTSGSVSALTCNYESSCTLTANGYTKTNYSFAGWATSATGSVVYTNKQSVTNLGNITLYAKWVLTTTTFSYKGSIETFTAEASGTYKLEVWGAQGGNSGGKGGYASGNISLTVGTKLYVGVGGQGSVTSGGYNGGGTGGTGSGHPGGGGGGGATHIAKTTNRGVLANYSSYRSEILIVAGGGGGNGGAYEDGTIAVPGGAGGGANGSSSSYSGKCTSIYASGATTSSGYSFGKGQNGRNGDGSDCGAEGNGGGGGGYFGGYAITTNGNTTDAGGGGGSGYIGGVTSGTTSSGSRSGNGYARITYVGS